MEMTDELAAEIAQAGLEAAENYMSSLYEFLTSKGLDKNQTWDIMAGAIETMYGLFLSHCLESEEDLLKAVNGLEKRVLNYACRLRKMNEAA